MTPDDLSPIIQQATRNAAAERSWCLLAPDRVLELAQAAREREDACNRLAEIRALMPALLLAWCCHHRETERELMEQIVKLCQSGS